MEQKMTGKIIAVLDEQSGIGKNGTSWRQREYVIQEDRERYPQRCVFKVKGENIEKFAMQIGDQVTVFLDVDAHEWQGKWFNDVTAWKVEKGGV